jgi:hypothetical protein
VLPPLEEVLELELLELVPPSVLPLLELLLLVPPSGGGGRHGPQVPAVLPIGTMLVSPGLQSALPVHLPQVGTQTSV